MLDLILIHCPGTDSEDETESDASEDENEDNTDVAGDTARVKLPYLPGGTKSDDLDV